LRGEAEKFDSGVCQGLIQPLRYSNSQLHPATPDKFSDFPTGDNTDS
jgi:hypothetical protein